MLTPSPGGNSLDITLSKEAEDGRHLTHLTVLVVDMGEGAPWAPSSLFGDRFGLAVVVRVGFVDRRRHDVVVASRYEQDRRVRSLIRYQPRLRPTMSKYS
jgi:hypothetical protein